MSGLLNMLLHPFGQNAQVDEVYGTTPDSPVLTLPVEEIEEREETIIHPSSLPIKSHSTSIKSTPVITPIISSAPIISSTPVISTPIVSSTPINPPIPLSDLLATPPPATPVADAAVKVASVVADAASAVVGAVKNTANNAMEKVEEKAAEIKQNAEVQKEAIVTPEQVIVDTPIIKETIREDKIIEVQPVIHKEISQNIVHHIEKHIQEAPAPNAGGIVKHEPIFEKHTTTHVINEIQPVIHREISHVVVEKKEEHLTEHITKPTVHTFETVYEKGPFSLSSIDSDFKPTVPKEGDIIVPSEKAALSSTPKKVTLSSTSLSSTPLSSTPLSSTPLSSTPLSSTSPSSTSLSSPTPVADAAAKVANVAGNVASAAYNTAANTASAVVDAVKTTAQNAKDKVEEKNAQLQQPLPSHTTVHSLPPTNTEPVLESQREKRETQLELEKMKLGSKDEESIVAHAHASGLLHSHKPSGYPLE